MATHKFVTPTSLVVMALFSCLAAGQNSSAAAKKAHAKAKASIHKKATPKKATRKSISKQSKKLSSPTIKGRMIVVGPAYSPGARGTANTTRYTAPVRRVATYQGQPWLNHFRPGITIVDSATTHNFMMSYGQTYPIPSFDGGTVVSNAAGMRVGYFQYVPTFADNFFYYSNYGYNPDQASYSPWYLYSNLPPYIRAGNTTIIPNYTRSAFNTDWVNYDSTTGNAVIDDVIDRLTTAFRSGNPTWVTKLLSTSDRIAIFLNGRYQYSVAAASFAKMLEDMVLGTQTTGYSVDQAQEWGHQLKILATHQFIDAVGATHYLRQEYVFGEDVYGKARLVEFGTSLIPGR